MIHSANSGGTGRSLVLSAARLGAFTALLCVGRIGAVPAAAQTSDINTDRQPGVERVAPTPRKTEGFQFLGDDSIDPNQPIKSSFVISVSVVGEPDASDNYSVDQAGNIMIHYQGKTPVAVKGLSPLQAQDAIARALKAYIKNPQVIVTIVSIPRPTIFVGGAVMNPGPVIIGPETTLVDLLSKAQWTENADLSQVRVTRTDRVNGEDKKSQFILNFDRYIKVEAGTTPDEKQNPVLQDRDRIFVPFKSLPGNGVVHVFGDVPHPMQNIPMRSNPPMTVREVINLVGGTLTTANVKAVSIRRATLDKPLVIDLDRANDGDPVNNIELKPDDAVYVERLENNAYINMNGGFVKTGKFVYDKRTTLTQAIMEAGGLAPYAKEKDCKVFRHPDNDPKHTQVISFNWGDVKKGTASDIDLQPGDSVWVTPGGPAQRYDPLSVVSNLAFLATAFRR